jgi:putative transposase
MPDHLHAFVALDDMKMSLPAWMKSLKNTLSKALREAGVEGPHWQKGYFDHVLRSAESYSEKWDYVRNNPMRAGLVTRWEDWPFLGEPFPLDYVRDRI